MAQHAMNQAIAFLGHRFGSELRMSPEQQQSIGGGQQQITVESVLLFKFCFSDFNILFLICLSAFIGVYLFPTGSFILS